MKIKEAVMQIPENERPAIIEEFRKTTSVEEVEAVAKKHNLNINAQVVYDKLSSDEVDEDALKRVAGGCSCGCGPCHSCGCTTGIRGW